MTPALQQPVLHKEKKMTHTICFTAYICDKYNVTGVQQKIALSTRQDNTKNPVFKFWIC